ncbi:MAG: VWA domain-containing protein [Myxococcales bacterium]|nr:VWA domain-containing protein [Myxococcales bacterium]
MSGAPAAPATPGASGTGVAAATPGALARAEASFVAAWPAALAALSPYTRLLPPVYCHTVADEKREGLTGSFAMIRLRDERIVVSLRQVVELGLEPHARAILAHEVGHYVHAPGTLREHVRLHDRIRRTLPPAQASLAGLVANLYTDLLLNDRLVRSAGVDLAAVYRVLRRDPAGPLWTVYLRMYERLWRLPGSSLVARPSPEVDADAELGARIVRLFRERFLDGAASFAKLLEPYLEKMAPDTPAVPQWLDTAGTPVGDTIPDGLTDDDFDPAAVEHPAVDARIAGDLEDDASAADEGDGDARAEGPTRPAVRGDGRPDRRSVRRSPQQYLDLLASVGVTRKPKELLARYYRELAMPHVIPFPAMRVERAGEPLPEGLDAWEAGSPLERIDWLETLLKSPIVVPGVTTVERSYGVTEGGEPERRPPDLYVGIDCSGSMGNPAHQLTYPVVAGVVLTLSALRAGARVMACLSGEWHGQGSHTETAGFVRDEAAILAVLVDYLGTGCSFGLPRLAETFVRAPRARGRPAHVLVVSDSDLFGEIEGTVGGWDTARLAVERAGGGATAVLRLASSDHYRAHIDQLAACGFEVHLVASEPELVAFARAFARRTFHFEEAGA